MFFTFFNFLYKLMIGSGSGNWFGGFRIRNTGTWNFDGINLIKSVLNLTCFFSSAFSISFFITEKRKWCSCSYWRTFFSVPLSEKIIIIRESYLFVFWKFVGISLINLVPPSIGAARRWVSERWCRRSRLCCGPGTRAQRWGAAAAARQPRVSGEGEGLPDQGGEGRGHPYTIHFTDIGFLPPSLYVPPFPLKKNLRTPLLIRTSFSRRLSPCSALPWALVSWDLSFGNSD